MKAEIISVGDELLAGNTVNTNTAYIAKGLTRLGFTVHRQSVVGDSEKDIVGAIKTAIKRSHVIVFTGGLGPTKDDLTKETVAKALGMTLVHDEETAEAMKAFFDSRGRTMSENNLKQAMVIKGATVLKNPNGTTPGMFIKSRNQAILLFPGPPRETEPMFDNEATPLLEEMCDDKCATTTLHVFGIAESSLEVQCKDLLYGDNPTSALYAKTGEVHITITARAKSEALARELMDKKAAQYRELVGDNVYSDDGKSLGETVVAMLQKAGTKVAVAESITGGGICSLITAVPRASKAFDLGIVAYSDKCKSTVLSVDHSIIKKYSSVSAAVAAEMAKCAAQKAHSALGLGITGIAGPTNDGHIDKPIGLVYIAVCDKARVVVRKFNFGAMRGRAMVRELSMLNAFDMLRRFVSGLAIEDSREFTYKDVADLDRARPKKKTSLAIEKGIIGTMCAALVIGGALFTVRGIRARMDEKVYSELQSSYGSSETADMLLSMSEVNPDTEGWLSTSGGALGCVVVKDSGDGFYRDHDFSRSSNSLGCPYIMGSEETSADPANIVIYGSSADSSQTFGPLLGFTDNKTLEANSLINLTTLNSSADYKVVAVYMANSNPELGAVQDNYLSQSFAGAEQFTDYVVDMKLRSIISIGTSIISTDRFLTLVTDLPDWDGAKLIVVARRVRTGEPITAGETVYMKNAAALYPEQYYTLNGTTSVINEVIERDKWKSWLLANEKTAGVSQSESAQNSGGYIAPDGTAKSPVSETLDGVTRITVSMDGIDTTDTPTNIVAKMIAAELGEAAADETIKAQAVASATWLRYSLNNTAKPAVRGAVASERITKLVSSVIGEGMFYDSLVAFTPYFSMSAGKTNTSAELFGLDCPYLSTVESVYDYQLSGYENTVTMQKDVLRSRLESYYSLTLSEDNENWIKVTDVTAAGYAKTVSIDGQLETSGEELRSKCLGLASADFTLTWNGAQSSFTTRGSGHGVGMSQGGANEYALALDWDYRTILGHYYPGVTFAELKWD